MKSNNSSENNQSSSQQNQTSNPSKEQSSLYKSLSLMQTMGKLGGNRLELALNWIETNNSLDDLAFATKRFKTESKQQELVKKWLSLSNLNSSDLFQNLKNSTIENSLKSEIAVAFLAVEKLEISWPDKEMTSEDLKNTLPFIDENEKSEIVESWITKGERTSGELKEIFTLVKDDYTKSAIAKSWISERERTSEDLKNTLPFIDENEKSEIVKSWIFKGERTSEDLKEIFTLVKDDYTKSAIAKSWISEKETTSEDLKNILPFVEYDGEKSEIVKSWISKGERTSEDLKNILPFVEYDGEKSEIVKSWISKGERTSEDLKNILPFVEHSEKSKIVKSWLLEKEKTFKDLKEILPFVYKLEIVESWISKGERTSEDLKEIFTLVKSDYAKSAIAESWITKGERTSEDLKEIFTLVKDDSYKSRIAESWISAKERTSEDLKEIFTLVKSDYAKSAIAESWITKGETTSEDLKNILPFVKHDSKKSKIVKSWLLEKEKTFKDLENTLSFVESNSDKSEIAKSWFCKGERTSEDLEKILPFVNGAKDSYVRESYRSEIIKSWISKGEKTSEDLKEIFPLLKNWDKSAIAKSWISEKETTSEDLKNILPFIDENEKSEIVESWITKGERTSGELKEIFTLVKDDYTKSAIAKSWISEKETTSEDLKNILPFVEHDSEKSKIVKSWFSKGERTSEDLKNILPFIDDEKEKSKFMDAFLNSSKENFIACAKEGLIGRNIYDLENIALRYSDSSLSASDFPNVAREIYPENTDLQSELLIEGIRQFGYTRLIQAKGNILSFIKDIPNGDRALEVIGVLDAKINLTSQEILSLADGRLSQTYESIGNTLKDYSVATGSNQAVINYFNQTFPGANLEETSLVSIFPFFVEMSDQTDQFKNSLKPEVLQKIRENFTPSSNKVLIKEKDFDKIDNLLKDPNSSISSPITNSGILWVTLISEALSQINLSNYPIEKIDQFSFGSNNLFNSISNQEESQKFTNLTKEFRALLKKEPATNDQVASFFEKLLSLDGKISEKERKSLGEFFNRDKFLLANLLNKDGGIDKFSALITTAGDGCFANIGTHARLAVVDSLDLSLNLKAIISVFNQHISNPVLSGRDAGVDHPIEGSNASTIFTDSRVNKNYISPIAFKNKLKEEFFKDGKKVRDSWEIIRNHYGKNSDGDDVFDDNHIDALINIGQNHTESLAADLATLFILEKQIPLLLENKHLQEFKNKTESLKRAIEEKAETKEEKAQTKKEAAEENPSSEPKKPEGSPIIGAIEEKGAGLN